jgi:hypothetical protein
MRWANKTVCYFLQPRLIDPKEKSPSFQKSFLYPEPESNRHGFPQVFETSASTNSAIRA